MSGLALIEYLTSLLQFSFPLSADTRPRARGGGHAGRAPRRAVFQTRLACTRAPGDPQPGGPRPGDGSADRGRPAGSDAHAADGVVGRRGRSGREGEGGQDDLCGARRPLGA
eukprot:scaffold26911_cov23-Prasinocladus_malaysianus.AAC.1